LFVDQRDKVAKITNATSKKAVIKRLSLGVKIGYQKVINATLIGDTAL
jgi:hypothetical protein